MNYQQIYNNLMQRGRERILEGYGESHHILPKCLDGPDDKTNLVNLTPEEHFLAHLLLVKMYPGHAGLSAAVVMMSGNQRCNNKLFGWARKKHAENMKSVIPWNKGIKTGIVTDGCFNKDTIPWNKGMTAWLDYSHTTETRKHLSNIANKRQLFKCNHCDKEVTKQNLTGDNCKLNIANIENVLQQRKEHSEQMKNNFKNKPVLTCPRCKTTGKQMKRYHFDNCKMKGVS